jgi:cytochrome c oxidase assembly protein subunit 15
MSLLKWCLSQLSPTVIFVPKLSPKTFRNVCGVALASLCVIVFTGALVRLTGSGLGCKDWPRCNETMFVDISSGHTAIEQLNRLFTGVVSASVMASVLLAYFSRPRRRDHILLAWSLVIGVLVQVVIGGIVVLTGLNPFANMLHFLVSMVLVASGFLLLRRTDVVEGSAYLRVLPPREKRLVAVLVVAASIALVTGTVVTATGPHAGDENAIRFGFALTTVARIHSISILITISIIILLSILAVRSRQRNQSFIDALQALLVVSVLQAGIGYTQYFTGVPVFLVGAHIIGATAFWLTVCHVAFMPRLAASQANVASFQQ